jgi:hypothetical protein
MYTMQYSDTSITLHLIKSVEKLTGDDIIRIRMNLITNSYELTYTDNEEKLVHSVSFSSQIEIRDHLFFVLENLNLDVDDYKFIQVSVPAMPRLLLSSSSLKTSYYRDHIMDLLNHALFILEKVNKIKGKNTKCSSFPELPGSPDTSSM